MLDGLEVLGAELRLRKLAQQREQRQQPAAAAATSLRELKMGRVIRVVWSSHFFDDMSQFLPKLNTFFSACGMSTPDCHKTRLIEGSVP